MRQAGVITVLAEIKTSTIIAQSTSIAVDIRRGQRVGRRLKNLLALAEFDQASGPLADPEKPRIIGNAPGLRQIMGHDHDRVFSA